jgi:hypothetical protein
LTLFGQYNRCVRDVSTRILLDPSVLQTKMMKEAQEIHDNKQTTLQAKSLILGGSSSRRGALWVQGWCQGRTQACQIPVVQVFAFGAPATNPVIPLVLAQHQRRWMAHWSSALDLVCPTRTETDTASRPIPPLGAHKGRAPTVMHAHSALQVTISPPSVPKRWDNIVTRPKGTDPHRVVTPLRADRWAAKLAKWGLYHQFGNIVYGIQHGFDMGSGLPLHIHTSHLITSLPQIVRQLFMGILKKNFALAATQVLSHAPSSRNALGHFGLHCLVQFQNRVVQQE